MRLSSRNYREYLHSSRSHPPNRSQPAKEAPHPFTSISYLFAGNLKPLIYTTVPAFLGLELWMEFQLDSFPTGISFPFGFIMFWTFFYTFRSPIKTKTTQFSKPKPQFKNEAASYQFKSASKSAADEIKISPVPQEIEAALLVLGLKDCREWNVIHKRYRELAKQVHPDLNPDLTAAENRFILYDGAYRKLMAVKDRYFKLAS